MRDLIESLVALLEVHLGIDPDPAVINYAIVIAAAALPLLWLYRWVLRQFGNIRALSSELEAVTRVILDDTKPEFQRLLGDVRAMQRELEDKLSRRLDTLSIEISSTHSVEDRPDDDDVEADASTDAPSRRTRLAMAESVRDVVLDRWLTGAIFRQHSSDPNTFHFYGMSGGGEAIYLYLQTPYRQRLGIDGRLSYTLDIWINRRKHLNFEWDIEGNYALRGFKKGDWIEDVAMWRMNSLPIDEEERKQA